MADELIAGERIAAGGTVYIHGGRAFTVPTPRFVAIGPIRCGEMTTAVGTEQDERGFLTIIRVRPARADVPDDVHYLAGMALRNADDGDEVELLRGPVSFMGVNMPSDMYYAVPATPRTQPEESWRDRPAML